MSELAQKFLGHLQQLAAQDRAALAVLRRSNGFLPGTYIPAFPHVERFVAASARTDDAWRLALYVTAGLFATYPEHLSGTTLAAAFGHCARRRGAANIELRFIALLSAEADAVANFLRQAVSLLKSDQIRFDYGLLLSDLAIWLRNQHSEQLDRVRQRWARDFYNELSSAQPSLSEK